MRNKNLLNDAIEQITELLKSNTKIKIVLDDFVSIIQCIFDKLHDATYYPLDTPTLKLLSNNDLLGAIENLLFKDSLTVEVDDPEACMPFIYDGFLTLYALSLFLVVSNAKVNTENHLNDLLSQLKQHLKEYPYKDSPACYFCLTLIYFNMNKTYKALYWDKLFLTSVNRKESQLYLALINNYPKMFGEYSLHKPNESIQKYNRLDHVSYNRVIVVYCDQSDFINYFELFLTNFVVNKEPKLGNLFIFNVRNFNEDEIQPVVTNTLKRTQDSELDLIINDYRDNIKNLDSLNRVYFDELFHLSVKYKSPVQVLEIFDIIRGKELLDVISSQHKAKIAFSYAKSETLSQYFPYTHLKLSYFFINNTQKANEIYQLLNSIQNKGVNNNLHFSSILNAKKKDIDSLLLPFKEFYKRDPQQDFLLNKLTSQWKKLSPASFIFKRFPKKSSRYRSKRG